MKALVVCALVCVAFSGILSASIIRVAREDVVPIVDELIKEEVVSELRNAEIPVAVEEEPAKVILEETVVPVENQRSAVKVVEVVEPVVFEKVVVDEPVVNAEKESVELLRSVSPVVAVEEPIAVVKETEVVVEPVVEDKVVAAVESLRNVEPVVEVVEPAVAVVDEPKKDDEPTQSESLLRSALPLVVEKEVVPAVANVEEEPIAPAVRTVAEVILDKAEAKPVEVPAEAPAVKADEVSPVESLKSVEPSVVAEEPAAVVVDEAKNEPVDDPEYLRAVPIKPFLEQLAESQAANAKADSVVEPLVEEKVVPDSVVAAVDSLRSNAPVVAVEEPIAVAVPEKAKVAEKVAEPAAEAENVAADETPAPAVTADEEPTPALAADATEEKVPVPEVPVEEKVIDPVESLRSALPAAEVEEPKVIVTEEKKETLQTVENEVVPAVKAIVEEKVAETEQKPADEPTEAVRAVVPIVEEVAPVKEVEQEPSDVLRAAEVKDDASTTARPNLIQQIIQPVNNLIQNSPLGPILNRGSTTAAPAAGQAENLNAGEVAAAANDETATTAAPNVFQQLGQNIQSFLNPNTQAAQSSAEGSTTARPNIIQQVSNAVGSVFNRPSSNSEQQPTPATGPIQSLVQNVQNFFRPQSSTTATESGASAAETPAPAAPLTAEDAPSA
ncbi:calphotin-like [Wyeomyia smithii]|uniref:calphotin-like n=1 Tax=Wyeomyia smithii TaxID=174621 RepID=UPI002467EFB2|nr:calphotin-like [Wyeomyia smithii]